MNTDTRQYGREYYKAHPEKWRRNYMKNIDARRECAKEYARRMWQTHPEYRAAHLESTKRRAAEIRRTISFLKGTRKALRALEKLF